MILNIFKFSLDTCVKKPSTNKPQQLGRWQVARCSTQAATSVAPAAMAMVVAASASAARQKTLQFFALRGLAQVEKFRQMENSMW